MLRGVVLSPLGVAHCVLLDGGAGEFGGPGQGILLGEVSPDGGDIATKVLSNLGDVWLLASGKQWRICLMMFLTSWTVASHASMAARFMSQFSKEARRKSAQ